MIVSGSSSIQPRGCLGIPDRYRGHVSLSTWNVLALPTRYCCRALPLISPCDGWHHWPGYINDVRLNGNFESGSWNKFYHQGQRYPWNICLSEKMLGLGWSAARARAEGPKGGCLPPALIFLEESRGHAPIPRDPSLPYRQAVGGWFYWGSKPKTVWS